MRNAAPLFLLAACLLAASFTILYLSLSQLHEQWNVHLIEDSVEWALAVTRNAFAYFGIGSSLVLLVGFVAAVGTAVEELA